MTHPYSTPHWGTVPGAIRSRGNALHPVYEPARPLPGSPEDPPIPCTQEATRVFWMELLGDVQKQTVGMSQSVPTEHPGWRHRVLRPEERFVWVPTGAGAVAQLNAAILATAQGLATFFIGNPAVVQTIIPPGHAGVLRGWGVDVRHGRAEDISVAIEVDGGQTLQSFTSLAGAYSSGAPGTDLNTWAILKESQTVKLVLTTAAGLTGPYYAAAWLSLWTWPVERGSGDSLRSTVLSAGQR